MLAIRTDRLLLRDFRLADLPAYTELRARPAFRRFSPEGGAHPEKAEELLRLFLAWSEERPRLQYQLAVVLPPREVIGSVGVRVASASERQGSFGCELDPRHWGRGYGREAAYIEVGQLDIFRDEDLEYARRLSLAGVPVEFHLYPGVPHEFDAIAFDSDVAQRARAGLIRVLRSL